MTSKSPVFDKAYNTISHILSQTDEMEAIKINVIVREITGLEPKQAQQQLYIAFEKGYLRRVKSDKYNSYVYRLASRFPDWGESYSDFKAGRVRPQRRKRLSIIESYKKASQIYRFDQLLRGAHA